MFCNPSRVFRIPFGATINVITPHKNPDHIVTFFLEQICRDGTINPARHADKDFLNLIILTHIIYSILGEYPAPLGRG